MHSTPQPRTKGPKVKTPFLRITNELNEEEQIQLVEGESLFLGSGANCRIRLTGENVRVMHCMFQFLDGRLVVQDWNTNGATLINGQPLESAFAMGSGDELRIDEFRISLQLDSLDEVVGHLQVLDNEILAPDFGENFGVVHQEEQPLPPVVESESLVEFESIVEPATADQLRESANEARAEASLPEFVDQFDDVSDDCLASFIPSTDDLQLLHEEIEHLQRELAQKDAQLAELMETGLNAAAEDTEISKDESERLVVRLEQLVEELDSADRRVLSLEEQLQMSDDANRAEQDERKYLEGWVEEIEKLVTSKIAEANAELHLVQKRADDLKAERDLAVRQLRSRNLSGPAEPDTGNPNETNELRSQLAEMQNCLNRKDEEIEMLRKQPKEFDKSDYESKLRSLEEKNRELEVETAREKAVISRQHAELLQVKNELEQELSKRKVLGEGDCRVQAMRQHLREIHQAEEETRKEQFDKSLAGRISKLWKRVDNR